MNMNRYKELGNNSFFQRDFKSALLNYSLALKEVPDDKEAKIGALLADLAFEKEDEAIALFEYYEVTKAVGTEDAEETIEKLIENVDQESNSIDQFMDLIENRLNNIEEGILFHEFIAHISSRENAREAIEDLIFSSKIIISRKEDFVELIGLLMENGFEQMAYNYIENALMLYPDDAYFYELLKRLESI